MKIIYKDLGFFDLFSEAFIVFKKLYKVLFLVPFLMWLPLEILPYFVNFLSTIFFSVSIEPGIEGFFSSLDQFSKISTGIKLGVLLIIFYMFCGFINLFIINTWAYCVSLRIVFLHLNNESEQIIDTLQKSIKDLLPLIVICIFWPIFFFVGIGLLIFPGLYVLCLLTIIYPVIIFESNTSIESIKRSIFLIKGKILYTLGLTIIIIFFNTIPIFLFEEYLSVYSNSLSNSIFILMIVSIFLAYSAVLTVLFYLKCRDSSESTD